MIDRHQQYCDVNLFTLDYKSLRIQIVDAAICYDCPFTRTVHLLVIRNALYVPAMIHNLLPPFLLREAGLIVKDTSKI